MDPERFEEVVMSALDKLREDVSSIKSDIAWMKGKLEGRAEMRHIVLTGISIFVAIGAVVVAILK